MSSLSENELRQLEAIERGLIADDPKFAASVRATDLPRYYRKRVIQGAALFTLGFALLLCYLISFIFGIVGFALMFVATLVMVGAAKKLRSPGDQSFGRSRLQSRSPTPKQGWRERAEERFRRRFEDRG